MTIPSAFNGVVGRTEAESFSRGKFGEWKNYASGSKIDMIDIRHDAVEMNLKEEILKSLKPATGPKTLPTLLLYDERGLQLFEEVSLR
jgi:L-histidine Nalpha-methyltransferase / hercynylcysteine S-oxide synthase